ncbi:uncharacterized protein LOC108680043 [Hyalella azteca]|uniref:Uncharacterized protein LOC108680043 n=1 Tax=Hyalella azteca TaxID=294128 RepID=A0A8B7PFC3_HYAAZ|nr:uncharacterized protein LOC108680043 [Hyalella azteca]
MLPEEEWCLNADTVLAGMLLLQHCCVTNLLELRIDLHGDVNPDVASDDLCSLGKTLSEVKLALSRRICKKINMCFNIQNHYENDGGRSERYLVSLVGWTNLIEFTGTINSEGVKHLSSFKYLKTLKLRISSLKDFKAFIKLSIRMFNIWSSFTFCLLFITPGSLPICMSLRKVTLLETVDGNHQHPRTLEFICVLVASLGPLFLGLSTSSKSCTLKLYVPTNCAWTTRKTCK